MAEISVDVHNGQILRIVQHKHDGITTLVSDSQQIVIQPGELVMLMNYFRNCKSGKEQSDYIKPYGKEDSV